MEDWEKGQYEAEERFDKFWDAHFEVPCKYNGYKSNSENKSVGRNKDIYNSIEKSNYHRKRLRAGANSSKGQHAYSQAFVAGDEACRYDFETQRRVLNRFKTSYERTAFWRGIRNGSCRGGRN